MKCARVGCARVQLRTRRGKRAGRHQQQRASLEGQRRSMDGTPPSAPPPEMPQRPSRFSLDSQSVRLRPRHDRPAPLRCPLRRGDCLPQSLRPITRKLDLHISWVLVPAADGIRPHAHVCTTCLARIQWLRVVDMVLAEAAGGELRRWRDRSLGRGPQLIGPSGGARRGPPLRARPQAAVRAWTAAPCPAATSHPCLRWRPSSSRRVRPRHICYGWRVAGRVTSACRMSSTAKCQQDLVGCAFSRRHPSKQSSSASAAIAVTPCSLQAPPSSGGPRVCRVRRHLTTACYIVSSSSCARGHNSCGRSVI